jgi:hypothetical protein
MIDETIGTGVPTLSGSSTFDSMKKGDEDVEKIGVSVTEDSPTLFPTRSPPKRSLSGTDGVYSMNNSVLTGSISVRNRRTSNPPPSQIRLLAHQETNRSQAFQ